MLHHEIRQARIDHGLSQAELARLSGVPRERVRQLETGGNVTLETFHKILAQLPNLKTVSLGHVQLKTQAFSLAEVRDALAVWLEGGRRLLTLLESVQPEPPADARIKPGLQLTPELEERLRRLEEQYKKT